MAAHKTMILKWRSQPYDGIKGVLPQWFPERSRKQFRKIQAGLCNAVELGEFSEEELFRKVHFYANGPEIVRMLAGRWRRQTAIRYLATLLRADKREQQRPGKGLRILPDKDLADEMRIGAASIRGSKAGIAAAWGTVEDRQETRRRYQEEVDRLAKANPRLTRRRINELAADKFDVNSRTIERHTSNPKKS